MSETVSLDTNTKFRVHLELTREDGDNFYTEFVRTTVLIPSSNNKGKPIIELLGDTIFKCLSEWSYIKGVAVKLLYYGRLYEETIVGFSYIEHVKPVDNLFPNILIVGVGSNENL